jgi:N-acetylglucosaminyldiphosphoundecaprenol N-acetyl-beta-D-mannosaminyltransferase
MANLLLGAIRASGFGADPANANSAVEDGEVRAVSFGPLRADAVSHAEALDIVEQLVRAGDGGAVFTPNVDHVVLAHDNPRMRAAYSRANLALADGMPLLWAARLFGEPLPEKVSGSDFVPMVLERAADRGWRVYFLGGKPGVAALARDKLRQYLPNLQVVGVDAPMIDAKDPASGCAPIVSRVRSARPDVVLVALGAPKQEIWIDLVRDELRPTVLLAVGASLDFIAGTVPRAPRWISRSGLEWLFRLSREPRRLWRRYLLHDPRFLAIVGREAFDRARRKGGRSLHRGNEMDEAPAGTPEREHQSQDVPPEPTLQK